MMHTGLRRCLALAAFVGVGLLADRPASAQNTYADAPFQQGSLFYRPSGAKPPQTVRRRPAAPTYRYANPQLQYAAPTTTYPYQVMRPAYSTPASRTGYVARPDSYYYYLPPTIQGPTPPNYYVRPY